ncbi:bifunctional 4-hydroxy-2-oxoglutarate aldolase/2-dehydro-3-deoxy-phosphogluconate aldolase [Paenibacillus sp. YYML68]|uniref:bifunctional 4-hydroxy-2-oxoglutarate aldolase/2-dehydro-3-deoxy-phosphogluconate aldolase n=1 Tax=Paenibacillus sp. YYML68 TaxID=2909250 RepID=UPI002491E648|nr:bifunctional 4-hydroxy-2-oxoglutarate aldolase/2-dehydro-3-deoxy-phosphogluconate aldolase [Paenibacillus sp. YYML68]
MMELQAYIEQHKVVAILRNVPPGKLERVLEALVESGVRLAEITLNSPGALEGIASMSKTFEGRLLLGAGTVMNRDQAKQAIEAGAQFLISPHVNEGVIETALEHGVVPMPGAMTPTEIVRAMEAGAPLVKLFPCSSLGPGYVKELLGPLHTCKLIAVGGINESNAADYIRAGAVGVGAGSSLVSAADIQRDDYAAITSRALQMTTSVHSITK